MSHDILKSNPSPELQSVYGTNMGVNVDSSPADWTVGTNQVRLVTVYMRTIKTTVTNLDGQSQLPSGLPIYETDPSSGVFKKMVR